MSLIVVGSVAYDGIETPHGSVDRILGGAATYIGLSASYFTDVSLVGVVGEDFGAEDREMLAGHGIDLEGLEQVAGKTFFWKGVYSADMNDRKTLRTDLNVFADFNPRLPESYRAQPYLMLGNIQPALQRSVRAQMNGVRLAGGDTMNYWIADFREELAGHDPGMGLSTDQRFRSAHAFGTTQPARGGGQYSTWGQTLVIKRGEFGAILFRREHGLAALHGARVSTRRSVRPTGAGDCFAGGFIGYLTQQGVRSEGWASWISTNFSRAVIYGSVMGSFCCEKFGVDRFRTLSRENIDARFASSGSSPNFENGLPYWFPISLAMVSALACFVVQKNGWTLYYGDAEAHLEIARRIVDSKTPGWGQIGAVWLPLPHLLMLPLVRSNFMWRTGLAGTIPSAVFFVLGGTFLFAAAREVFQLTSAALVTTGVFALNPNILYLQATPMTESIFYGSLMALFYFTVLFERTQSRAAIVAAGVATITATLTRYEGWFLIPFVALFFLPERAGEQAARNGIVRDRGEPRSARLDFTQRLVVRRSVGFLSRPVLGESDPEGIAVSGPA